MHLMPDDASPLFTLPFTLSWLPGQFRYFKGSLLHQCFQSQRHNFPRLQMIDIDWDKPKEMITVYDRTQILENMCFHLHVRRTGGFAYCGDKTSNFDFGLFNTLIDSYYPDELLHFKTVLSSEFGIQYDILLGRTQRLLWGNTTQTHVRHVHQEFACSVVQRERQQLC